MLYPFKTKPFEHQLTAWEMSKDKQYFALFMDMGTGKSKVLIDTAAYLYDNGKIDGLLVIAPKGAYRTWYNITPEGEHVGEIVTHMPAHIKYFATWWSAYKTKQHVLTYDKLFKETEDLHILVMNVEAFSIKGSAAALLTRRFLSSHRTLMAVDEATTIKNLKAQRTKSIISLGSMALAKRILTGRPVVQSPMDLYGQCLFLHQRLLGFASFYSFRSRYAIMQQMTIKRKGLTQSFDKVVGFQRVEELTEKIKEFSFHITKEECLDLPPKLYQYRDSELSDEQTTAYNQMKKLSMMTLDALTVVTAPMVMVQLQKLHEIVCGFIRDPVTGQVRDLKHNRLEDLMEILEETSNKVTIWATYTRNVEKIYARIKEEYGERQVMHFYGGTSPDDRELAKQRFQDPDDPLRFLVLNPATGKFGNTLTQAYVSIYYSNSHDLEHRDQSEQRSHRIGLDHSLLILDQITRGTVDEKIIKNLRDKRRISDAVMGDGYREWLK